MSKSIYTHTYTIKLNYLQASTADCSSFADVSESLAVSMFKAQIPAVPDYKAVGNHPF
jgi:hypothetical protein